MRCILDCLYGEVIDCLAGLRALPEAPQDAPAPGDMVKLNVGGARFETSRAALTRVEDSMLGRMFGRCEDMLQPDPFDGSFYIGRDGKLFGMILDFLADADGPKMQQAIYSLPEPAQDALVQELDYFCLLKEVFGVRRWVDDAVFRPGPTMSSRRFYCAAVCAKGRVFVFGGVEGYALNTTEVLDAQTLAVTPGPDLLTGRDGCAAVQIDADRVLLLGGFGTVSECLSTTEILHLPTLTVSPGPDSNARSGCAAVALDSNRILVVGGYVGWPASNTGRTEVLSLDTMAFAPGPAMAAPRSACAVVALDEHRFMVAGGYKRGCLNSTEILDVRTMAFTPGPNMNSARSACAAVPVDEMHVLIIGGMDSNNVALATTELLDVAKMEFEPGPPMGTARIACAATRLETADGPRILVVGGSDDGYQTVSTTEVLAA